jgi:hypothetical protein
MSDAPGFQDGQKIVSLFDQGKRFTEELLKENERLRLIVKTLTEERRKLKAVSTEQGIEQMRQKIELLEAEKAALEREMEVQRRETASMEEENREFADRYIQVEKQNSDLISMYVASYQLHSTLNYDEVLVTVKDITINMMGGEVFGIYFIDTARQELMLVAHEGMEGREGETLPLDDETIKEVFSSGGAQFKENRAEYHDGDEPVAYLPLTLGDDPFGIIIIYKLLIQKEGFRSLDYELVELLGKHAASALYSAKIHTVSERKRNTLQGFIDLIKWDHTEPGEAR